MQTRKQRRGKARIFKSLFYRFSLHIFFGLSAIVFPVVFVVDVFWDGLILTFFRVLSVVVLSFFGRSSDLFGRSEGASSHVFRVQTNIALVLFRSSWFFPMLFRILSDDDQSLAGRTLKAMLAIERELIC